MTAHEPPTTSEMLRVMQSVIDSQKDVVSELKDLRGEIGRTYVPRGEWVEARKGDGRRMTTMEQDIEDLQKSREGDQSWRRSASLTIAVAAIGWLLTIIALVFAVTVQ